MVGRYEEEWLEREFIGYGMDMPDPQWPNKAKVCVSIVVQYNMGAELSPLNGDEDNCGEFLEIPKATGYKGRNESAEQMYEFGGREGTARLLKLFNKYKLPVTWNVFTRALEKAPYWVKPIVESGAEISCGGDRYRDNIDVDPKEEDQLIGKSIDKLQELTGDKTLPQGWLVERRSNLSVKLYSLTHKERNLPLQYSSDSCSDDLPYWVPSPAGAEEGLLMIPFTYDTSDLRFNMTGSGWASPKDWCEYLKETFDCFYEEAEDGEPKMMTILIHPHIAGRPNRTFWLEEFIKYASSKEAYFARRIDIANHWKKIMPYDKSKAFGQGKPPAPCGQIAAANPDPGRVV